MMHRSSSTTIAALLTAAATLQGCVLDSAGTCHDRTRCTGSTDRDHDVGDGSSEAGDSATSPGSTRCTDDAVCEDGDPCTADTCTPEGHCRHDPFGEGHPLDPQACQAMSCQAGLPTPSGPTPTGTPCGEGGLCDGAGSCTSPLGGTCTLDGDCTSGHCVEGICCARACDGTCEMCNLETFTTCRFHARGESDTACGTTKACDAQATCKLLDGESCTLSAQCLSNDCAFVNGDFRCAPRLE
ncbi:hypothetical protein [Chondromyces apiculatus]|uniref:Uncharacterized protein n=1 Tax=Chondromyces apiculatus DSM 436 TaxID=1192034 RepID=A0A017STU8_9BACT|nr:hypothetical protein [Chondromyces apiculatus]EYF00192.1 Hypothetical protein CAP_1102 [Chondromyces apiculatus DSM 436]